jgi:hypothetical protein
MGVTIDENKDQNMPAQKVTRRLGYLAGVAACIAGSVLGLTAMASAAPSLGGAVHHRITPGTPVVNLGTVTPTLDNGGMGTFDSTPLPGPRSPNVLPNP